MAITTTTGSDSHSQAPSWAAAASSTSCKVSLDVECVKCASCGFTEDCTPAYISRVRDRFHGRWICGLCVEAVKDELLRSDRLISTEEALNRHISFCSNFRSSSPQTNHVHPISAIGRIFRRSLDSPGAVRSSSAASLDIVERVSPEPTLIRSGSCLSSISS
ncbi:hypothetical protein L484_027410 [Morus notabilis]|uniref:DUF1677 family protein n=1 Tax=Morus notabilis TaxID=981085 RepID=W9QV02_9ROSA|nr:uncharacterized protein LOC21410031 [Morus notabilis]EXB38974.1 hypothetical protein L484_027410 [Morus notabilis]